MRHVGTDQMTSRQGAAERQLAGQNGGSHDAGQASGVLAWAGRVRATDAKHVEHGGLGLEDGAAAEGADL
jgi:hypothetical protein